MCDVIKRIRRIAGKDECGKFTFQQGQLLRSDQLIDVAPLDCLHCLAFRQVMPNGTMLHEMIHAAKPQRVEHDGDPRSVFSENVGGRDQLPAHHAEALATSFFAR